MWASHTFREYGFRKIQIRKNKGGPGLEPPYATQLFNAVITAVWSDLALLAQAIRRPWPVVSQLAGHPEGALPWPWSVLAYPGSGARPRLGA